MPTDLQQVASWFPSGRKLVDEPLLEFRLLEPNPSIFLEALSYLADLRPIHRAYAAIGVLPSAFSNEDTVYVVD